MSSRTPHSEIDRQMRAAERSRKRAMILIWAIGGTFSLGIAIAMTAWAIGSGAGEKPLPAVTPTASEDTGAVAAQPPVVPEPGIEDPVAEVPVDEPVPTPEAEQDAEPAKRPAPAPAPKPAPKPAATVQKFSIGLGDYGYEPTVVTAKAGTPIQLTVAQGEGCAAGFLIAELGVAADNSTRAAVVSLPALSPGTYRFTCGMEMVEGRLVVQ